MRDSLIIHISTTTSSTFFTFLDNIALSVVFASIRVQLSGSLRASSNSASHVAHNIADIYKVFACRTVPHRPHDGSSSGHKPSADWER